jgi:hypothetical protein
MRQLTSAELIQLWERGHEMPPARRAVALAEAALAGQDGPAAADLPVGDRDHRLMLLRGRLFGPRVSGQDSCAECGTVLDVSFDLGALAAGHAPAATPVTVRVGKRVLRCRPLTTADLIAVAEADGPDFRVGLLARCVTGSDGQAATGLSAPAMAKVMSALSAADPLADVRLAVTCGECGYQWDITFDIASFLWTEICAAVERLLSDVHVLARAYGWSEAAILALSPTRRAAYLEMCDP